MLQTQSSIIEFSDKPTSLIFAGWFTSHNASEGFCIIHITTKLKKRIKMMRALFSSGENFIRGLACVDAWIPKKYVLFLKSDLDYKKYGLEVTLEASVFEAQTKYLKCVPSQILSDVMEDTDCLVSIGGAGIQFSGFKSKIKYSSNVLLKDEFQF